MAEINYSVLAAAAALVLTAGAATALTNDANTKAALATLEKSAYDAWKSKDAAYWDSFLSDRFVGWGRPGSTRHQRQRNTQAQIATSRATRCPTKRSARWARMLRCSHTGRQLTAHAGDKRSRRRIGQRAYTCAKVTNGRQSSTRNPPSLIQKRPSRYPSVNRPRLNPRLEILRPTPYLPLKETCGKPGESTMQKNRGSDGEEYFIYQYFWYASCHQG